MNNLSIPSGTGSRVALAILAAVVFGQARSSFAGLTLMSSSGSATFGVYTTFIPEENPSTFKADGSLQAPGFGLPVLNSLMSGLANQSVGSGSLVPGFTAISTTNDNPAANGVPTVFGTSATEMFASGTGQGALLPQGGILWSTKTNLSDKLTAPNEASVSIFYATATFKNTTLTTVDLAQGTFGTLLNIKGTLGSTTDGSYIAAGLSSTYQVTGSSQATQIDGVVLAGQGTSAFSSTGLVVGDAHHSQFTAGVFSGTASAYAGSDVMVGAHQSITLTATLTLITDPFSSITVDTDLDPGYCGSLPTFGVSAKRGSARARAVDRGAARLGAGDGGPLGSLPTPTHLGEFVKPLDRDRPGSPLGWSFWSWRHCSARIGRLGSRGRAGSIETYQGMIFREVSHARPERS